MQKEKKVNMSWGKIPYPLDTKWSIPYLPQAQTTDLYYYYTDQWLRHLDPISIKLIIGTSMPH